MTFNDPACIVRARSRRRHLTGRLHVLKDFAVALRSARVLAGMRQSDLQERTGLSKFKLYELEAGILRDPVEFEIVCEVFPELKRFDPFGVDVTPPLPDPIPAPPPTTTPTTPVRAETTTTTTTPVRATTPPPTTPVRATAGRPLDVVRLLARAVTGDDVVAILRMALSSGYDLHDLSRAS